MSSLLNSYPNRLLSVVGVLALALPLLVTLESLKTTSALNGPPGARSTTHPDSAALSSASSPPEHVTLYQTPHHPALLHNPIIPLTSPNNQILFSEPRYRAFHDLLDLYTVRQGIDDNFTIRVIDQRTNEVLELFTLQEERAAYQAGLPVDWDEIDQQRRLVTRDLSKKYQALGVPKEDIIVRWGRLNQVQEAWNRDRAYINYELRMAKWFGLSLLVTELGTVETFNQDWMVSSVGARSRYQLMPFMLNKYGLHHYSLKTRSGETIRVREEQHPLLVMQPAFTVVRAYSNALGHELAGLTSYNTGPGNVFKALEAYLETAPDTSHTARVIDGYVWALTDGYDQISRKSSFRTQSRAFMPTAYGSLRAVEHDPIDLSHTFTGELVQVKAGEHMYLSALLTVLAKEAGLDWGFVAHEPALYERVRRMNPHIDLPPADSTGTLPAGGDLLLANTSSKEPTRLFLPLGTTAALTTHDLSVFDARAMIRYDEALYPAAGITGEKTEWDHAYDALVADIGRFGFTVENQRTLEALDQQFRALAREQPTPYRLAQLDVIQLHRQAWGTSNWRRLAGAVKVAYGTDENRIKRSLSPAGTTVAERVGR